MAKGPISFTQTSYQNIKVHLSTTAYLFCRSTHQT